MAAYHRITAAFRLAAAAAVVSRVMISFIVPAHNEEAWVGRCVEAIRYGMEIVGEAYEIVVVDDASSDSTSTVAERAGAKVMRVELRQISATRNAGARVALGEVFFFVDADTLVSAPLIRSALDAIRGGAVGGGCVPHFEGWLPFWWRLAYPLAISLVYLLRMTGGACQFCTRQAFAAIGGFSEAHYAAEDAVFVKALKRRGSFFIPPEKVLTSGRNLRAHSPASIVRLLLPLVFRGPDAFRSREGLDLWYQPKREKIETSVSRNDEKAQS
jgi:glycosyltransferase involved in cell wall biosynthesis